MFENHNMLGLCLTLALSVAGFSDAQAAPIIIYTFDVGDQSTIQGPSTVPTPSAIGAERFMDQTGDIDVVGGVLNGINFATHDGNRFAGAGTVITEWNGQGEDSTLEGVDLTDRGRNGFFDVNVQDKFGGEFGDLSGNTLTLIITDSSNAQSSISREWEDLEIGRNFIPFSDFVGGADFSSVDIIRLEQRMPNPGFNPTMEIDSISVVDAPDIGPVDLTGTVEDQGGTALCALVLASGQFDFSCNPNGPYSLLGLPTESDGTVKRQVYVDGFFPNVETLLGSTDETVVMTRVPDCPDYNTFPEPGVFPDSASKIISISGTVLLQDTQTPVCAMALANGKFGFTCDGTGSYNNVSIPLDANGQYKLQVYAQGFAPMVQRFDEFSPNVEVRLARASECL